MSVEKTEPATSLARLEQAGALTPVSLTLPGNISVDEYEAVGVMLSAVRDSLHWAIGDWIAHGEAVFGEESYQYIEAARISEASRQQYIRVATRIPKERRNQQLTWSHHRAVVALEPAEQDRWLREAAFRLWSKAQLEDELAMIYPRPAPPTGYVEEAVLAAAEDIWGAAMSQQRDDGQWFCVPAATMEALGRALGQIE